MKPTLLPFWLLITGLIITGAEKHLFRSGWGAAAQATTTTAAPPVVTTIQPKPVYRILDCTSTATNANRDCNLLNFVLYRLGPWMFPGAITAVLVFLCGYSYFSCKYACNCCGGRHQTPNFCFPAQKFPARYSKSDILRPKVTTVLSVLLMGGGGVWIYVVGYTPLVSGFALYREALSNSPGAIDKLVPLMKQSMTVVRRAASQSANVSEDRYSGGLPEAAVNATKKLISAQLTQLTAGIESYFAYLWIALLIICFAPGSLGIFELVCSLASLRKYGPMIIMFLSLSLAIVVWTSQGVLSGLSITSDYLCADYQGLLNMKAVALPVAIGCNETFAALTRDAFGYAAFTASQQACVDLTALCYNPSYDAVANAEVGTVFDCASSGSNLSTKLVGCGQAAGSMTYAALALSFGSMVVDSRIDSIPGSQSAYGTCVGLTASACSLAACASTCTASADGALSPIGLAARQAYYSLAAARKLSDAVATWGTVFGSCAGITELLVGPLRQTCTTFRDVGLVTARQGMVLIGCGLLMLLYSCGWGAKRNIPLSMANEPIEPIEPPKTAEENEAEGSPANRVDEPA
mgnify:FL=1